MKTQNVQSRGVNNGAGRNTVKKSLVVLGALALTSLPLFAQSGPPTVLPIDPSFMYTSVSAPTIAATSIAIGFAAVFMVIRYIRKGITKA